MKDCLVHFQMFSSIPDPYSLDAHSTSTSYDDQKCFRTLLSVLQGANRFGTRRTGLQASRSALMIRSSSRSAQGDPSQGWSKEAVQDSACHPRPISCLLWSSRWAARAVSCPRRGLPCLTLFLSLPFTCAAPPKTFCTPNSIHTSASNTLTSVSPWVWRPIVLSLTRPHLASIRNACGSRNHRAGVTGLTVLTKAVLRETAVRAPHGGAGWAVDTPGRGSLPSIRVSTLPLSISPMSHHSQAIAKTPR